MATQLQAEQSPCEPPLRCDTLRGGDVDVDDPVMADKVVALVEKHCFALVPFANGDEPTTSLKCRQYMAPAFY